MDAVTTQHTVAVAELQTTIQQQRREGLRLREEVATATAKAVAVAAEAAASTSHAAAALAMTAPSGPSGAAVDVGSEVAGPTRVRSSPLLGTASGASADGSLSSDGQRGAAAAATLSSPGTRNDVQSSMTALSVVRIGCGFDGDRGRRGGQKLPRGAALSLAYQPHCDVSIVSSTGGVASPSRRRRVHSVGVQVERATIPTYVSCGCGCVSACAGGRRLRVWLRERPCMQGKCPFVRDRRSHLPVDDCVSDAATNSSDLVALMASQSTQCDTLLKLLATSQSRERETNSRLQPVRP